jgi:hypothetical protein
MQQFPGYVKEGAPFPPQGYSVPPARNAKLDGKDKLRAPY